MPRIDRILLRAGTAAQWTSANPTLDANEPGYETDTRKMKIGDGASAWNALLYTAGEQATAYEISKADVESVLTGRITTHTHRNKQSVGVGGRWYLEPDNRWVGFSVSYGAQTENYSQPHGTGTEPNVLWNALGPFIRDGARVTGFRIAGRVNNTEVTAIDLRVYHQTGPWDGTWDSVAETVRTELLSEDGLTMNLTDQTRHIFDIDETVVGDGYLLVCLRPVGTITTRRFLTSSAIIEWESP